MEKLEPKYITGLNDGEGSFHINIRKWSKNKNGYSISAEFSIDLVSDDLEILERLKETFGCGTIIPKRQIKRPHVRLQSRYHVTNLNDINKIIVPFFKKHPPQMPTKKKDFQVWCKILDLMNAHRIT